MNKKRLVNLLYILFALILDVLIGYSWWVILFTDPLASRYEVVAMSITVFIITMFLVLLNYGVYMGCIKDE